jgi:acetylornithine deacetylase
LKQKEQHKIMNSTQILKKLISFDTVSCNSNLELLDWVEGYLAKYNVISERFYDETGLKANIWATIGDVTRPGYIFSGHTDVVPVEGQAWTHNPFDMIERDGKLFGRGTCDMKGFLACVLALVPQMVAAKLQAPIHLAFSHDEETGCIGVRTMLSALAQRPVTPKMCFVGEPTMMNVVVGHKGKRSVRVTIKGKEAHSSLAPQGVSAVNAAARLIVKIEDIAARLKQRKDLDMLYDVPESTANVGVMRGGQILNIVAGEAVFDFEFRVVAGDDVNALVSEVEAEAAKLLVKMREIEPSCSIVFSDLSEIPVFDVSPTSEVVQLAKRFAKKNSHSKVAYGTEAGLFQMMANIPTVVVGPGSIEQAHKPDEFIDIAQLHLCEEFIRDVIKEACL